MEVQTQPPPPDTPSPADIVATNKSAPTTLKAGEVKPKNGNCEKLKRMLWIFIAIYFLSGSIIATYSSSVTYALWNDRTVTEEYLNEICNDQSDVFWRESCDEYDDCKIVTPKRRSSGMLIVNSIYIFLSISCGILFYYLDKTDNECIQAGIGCYGCMFGSFYITAVCMILVYGHGLAKDISLARLYCDYNSDLYQTLNGQFGFIIYVLICGYAQVLYICCQIILVWIHERENPSTDGMI